MKAKMNKSHIRKEIDGALKSLRQLQVYVKNTPKIIIPAKVIRTGKK